MHGGRTPWMERDGRQVGRWRWPMPALWAVLLAGRAGDVIPLVATVMAGLSLAASYGLSSLVFQRGIGAVLVGLDEPVRGIAPWVPVFVFAFLCGISMDSQVFLVERMRELCDAGASARDAARDGLAGTGRVILSAALIMIVAFGGFVGGRMVEMKQSGFALAAAVAVDALLIRLVVVPAIMHLAGERGWGLGRGRRDVARGAPRPYDREVVRP